MAKNMNKKLIKSIVSVVCGLGIISTIPFTGSCSYSKQPESVQVKYDNSFDSPTIIGYIGVDETIDNKSFSAIVSPSGAPNDVTFTIEEGTDSRIKIGGTDNNQLVWGNFTEPTDITFKVIATSNIVPTVFGELEVTLSIQRPNPTSIKLAYSGESTNLVATIKDTTKSTGKVSSQVMPSYARPEVTYQIRNNDSSVNISLDSDGYITWPQFQTPTNQDIHFDVLGTADYGGVTDSISFTLKAIYAQTASVELSYSSEDKNLRGYISENGDSGTDKLSAVVKPDNADQSVTYEVNIAEQYKDSILVNSSGMIKWSAIDNTIDSIPFSVVAKSTADSSKISDPINFNLEITRRNPTKLTVNYSESTNLETTILNQTKSTGTLSVAIEPVLAFDDYEWIVNDPNNLGIQIDENNYIAWNTFNEPTDEAKSFNIQAKATHGGALSNVVNFTIKAVYQPSKSLEIYWLESSTNIPVVSSPAGTESKIKGLSGSVSPNPGADQSLIWSIDNTTNFSINETTGEITVKNNISFGTTLNFTVTAKSKTDQTMTASKQFTYTATNSNVLPYSVFQIDSSGQITGLSPDFNINDYPGCSVIEYPAQAKSVATSVVEQFTNLDENKQPETIRFQEGSKLTDSTFLASKFAKTVDFSNCLDLTVLAEFGHPHGFEADEYPRIETLILPVNIEQFTGFTLKFLKDLKTIIWDGNNTNQSCKLDLTQTGSPTLEGSAFQFTSVSWKDKSQALGSFLVRNTTSSTTSQSIADIFYNSYHEYNYTPFISSNWIPK